MNRLDERLKERARREDCPVPQGFDGRMDAILEGLPEGRRKPGPRRLRRWVVAGVLAAALCVGGVAAASGALELIARPGGFGGTAEGFQPYSAEVGASVTDQGYTLTLDGIGVDEAFITIYATITGEEPIPDWGGEEGVGPRGLATEFAGGGPRAGVLGCTDGMGAAGQPYCSADPALPGDDRPARRCGTGGIYRPAGAPGTGELEP